MRADLIQTAVTLLLDVGYQEATVARITADRDVSARTFSRYFPCKDDVFLAVLEPLSNAVLDELTQMPVPSAPLEALRAAHVAVLTRIAAHPMGTPSAHQLATMSRVLRSSTALRTKVGQYRDQRVRTTLADKMGVAEDDYRIELATSIFTIAAVSVIAQGEPDQFTPTVALQQIQTALADVVDTVATLDVRSLRPTTAT